MVGRSSTDLANVRSEVAQLKEDTRQAFTQSSVQMRKEIANSNAAFARTLARQSKELMRAMKK